MREIFRNLVTAQGTRLARSRDELLSVFSASGARYPATARSPTGSGRLAGGRPSAPADHAPEAIDQALDYPSRHQVGTGSGRGSETRVASHPRSETSAHNRSTRGAASVLDSLIDARLLTAYEEPAQDDDGEPQQRIEIIHESLLNNWPRLVRWRTQDADSAQLKDQLRQAAQMWIERGRPEDLLWTGTSYKEYELWRERYEGGLSESEETFAGAMKTKAERQKRRKRLIVTAGFALLLSVAATLALFWQRSESARQEAVAAERQAQASNLYGLAQMQPEEEPSAFLAYAAASLEQADNAEVRREIVRALWRGPPGFRLPADSRDTVDFSPDGQWLATASRAEGIRLWPSDGSPATLLEGSATGWEASRVHISPRGDVLAHDRATEGASPSQRRWREVILWSVPDGRLLRSLKFDNGTTRFFSFSADGTKIFTITEIEQGGGGVEEVRSWPVAGGESTLVARLELDSWRHLDLTAVDPTGTRLAWMEGGRLFISQSNGSTFDQGSAVEVVHAQDVVMFCFDSRGNKLATIDAEGAIRIWSLDTGLPQLDRTLVAKGSTFDWLRFDSTATWLVSRGEGIRNLHWPPDTEPWPLHFADRLFEDDVSWPASRSKPRADGWRAATPPRSPSGPSPAPTLLSSGDTKARSWRSATPPTAAG